MAAIEIEIRELTLDIGRILSKAEAEKRDLSRKETHEIRQIEDKIEDLRDELASSRRHFADLIESDPGSRSMLRPPADDRQAAPPSRRARYDSEMVRALDGYFRRGKFESRTLQMDLDTAGGYAVLPESITTEILHDLDNSVFVRGLARMFRVAKSASLGIPIMDADVSDPEFTSEVAEADLDSAMSFEKRALYPRRLVKAIKVSRDLIERSSANIAEFIINRLTQKISVVEESKFLTGSGSNEPLGIFTVSDFGVSTSRDISTGNTNTAITADGLINALYNLKGQYIRSGSCRWIFHRDAIKMIRKLKDGSGTYLWQAGLGDNRPSTILGIPYTISEYCPNTFTSGLRVGCVGDLSFYGIAEADQISVQALLEKYALENCNAYVAQTHVDGGPLIEEAFSMVTLA
ncbi:phage major capsid protein [Desulfatiglans anilini]|uniref:phage major capsid protein n=1 Tax=Desulfatiglans anilini TaxID=90728 RepID=UPI0003FC0A19|nr:phage major capsid protein [Desulfatiglans anilini]